MTDDLPDPKFPERGRLLQFPHHPVSTDGFIKSRQVCDRKNRSVSCTFKLMPEEARLLEELAMEYRGEGYRTVSDVVRHAIRDHIARLMDEKMLNKRGTLENTWAQLQVMLDQMRDDRYSADWDQIMAGADEYIKRCQHIGAKGEIKKYLRRLRLNTRAINSEFWREFYDRELKNRWGEYL